VRNTWTTIILIREFSYNGALVVKRRKEGEKHKGKSPFLLEEEAWVVQVGPRVVLTH
jgi:hypothetical protein